MTRGVFVVAQSNDKNWCKRCQFEHSICKDKNHLYYNPKDIKQDSKGVTRCFGRIDILKEIRVDLFKYIYPCT